MVGHMALRKQSLRTVELELTSPSDLKFLCEQRASQGVAPVHPWRSLIADSIEFFGVDPTGACKWFDPRAKGCASQYSGWMPIPAVVGHLASHHCGEGPAPAKLCALARALYGLFLAVDDRKAGTDLALCTKLAADTALQMGNDYTALWAASDRLRDAIHAQVPPNLAAARLYQRVGPFAESVRATGDLAKRFVAETASPEPRKTRKSQRPVLVNAEAELLERDLCEEDDVNELIKDIQESASRAATSALQRIRSRRKGPAELLQIKLKPWRD